MDVYETLREILDAHPTGAPRSPVFEKILRMLFTPGEAELLTHMTFAPRPVEAIAAAAGVPVEEADRMLGALADRVLVFSREKGGKRSYGLLPAIPGLFEFPFMRGEMTPELEDAGETLGGLPPGRPRRVFRRESHARGPRRSRREINRRAPPGPSLRGGQEAHRQRGLHQSRPVRLPCDPQAL